MCTAELHSHSSGRAANPARSDGTLNEYVPHVAGQKYGIAKTYYKSGKIHLEIPYRYDNKEGIFKEYNEDGTVKQQIPYKNNQPSGIETSF